MVVFWEMKDIFNLNTLKHVMLTSLAVASAPGAAGTLYIRHLTEESPLIGSLKLASRPRATSEQQSFTKDMLASSDSRLRTRLEEDQNSRLTAAS